MANVVDVSAVARTDIVSPSDVVSLPNTTAIPVEAPGSVDEHLRLLETRHCSSELNIAQKDERTVEDAAAAAAAAPAPQAPRPRRPSHNRPHLVISIPTTPRIAARLADPNSQENNR